MQQNIELPKDKGECHNELEVAVLIGNKLSNASTAEIRSGIWGYGLGLDLTLRDVQQQLKSLGHAWEMRKAFDASCPLSPFIPAAQISNPQDLSFSLEVNGSLRQQGNTKMMIRGIVELIAEMSTIFTLSAGDVVMTGTPKGVAALFSGDKLTANLADQLVLSTTVN